MNSSNCEIERSENESIEIELLLTAINKKYGYDFRNYAKATIKRRIYHRIERSGLKSISDLQHKILYDKNTFYDLLSDFSINVTEMFRDPTFYRILREEVLPELSALPFVKIWHAGCSTGEEVYSMAILLKEAGLYNKTRIYATDFDKEALEVAANGVYPIERLKEYTRNYRETGGVASFVDYYSAKYDFVLLDNSLKENILFSNHNLVTDGVFGEMDMIVCRNVLIYFNSELQNSVLKLFSKSLSCNSFLCLGLSETISLSDVSKHFDSFNQKEKIYKKKSDSQIN